MIRQMYPRLRIYSNQIPMRIKAAETSAMGVSIFQYEPKSEVARAYAGLAKEVKCYTKVVTGVANKI